MVNFPGNFHIFQKFPEIPGGLSGIFPGRGENSGTWIPRKNFWKKRNFCPLAPMRPRGYFAKNRHFCQNCDILLAIAKIWGFLTLSLRETSRVHRTSKRWVFLSGRPSPGSPPPFILKTGGGLGDLWWCGTHPPPELPSGKSTLYKRNFRGVPGAPREKLGKNAKKCTIFAKFCTILRNFAQILQIFAKNSKKWLFLTFFPSLMHLFTGKTPVFIFLKIILIFFIIFFQKIK